MNESLEKKMNESVLATDHSKTNTEHQSEKIQVFYEKMSDLLDEIDPEGEYHEELLIASTQALADKVAQSYEEDFQYYLIKDLGDMMHAFCLDYAQSYLEESEQEASSEPQIVESNL